MQMLHLVQDFILGGFVCSKRDCVRVYGCQGAMQAILPVWQDSIVNKRIPNKDINIIKW